MKMIGHETGLLKTAQGSFARDEGVEDGFV